MPVPTVDDKPVTCEKCGHEFKSFMYRVVTTEQGETLTLIDRDNDVVYDLVKVCHYCRTVFHYHTKEKTLIQHSAIYQSAFEKLMSHYQPPHLK